MDVQRRERWKRWYFVADDLVPLLVVLVFLFGAVLAVLLELGLVD